MLNRFTVQQRMYLIIASILVLFLVMIFFAIQNGTKARDMGITKTGQVMLENQKQKIKIASHAMALTTGHAVENIKDKNVQIELLRKLVGDVRYEKDKSGYFFIFEETLTIAMPAKKALEGKNLSEAKDKNGIFFVKELRDKAKGGGGFVQYIWPKPGAGDTPKLSYAEMIPGTNMWLGTGVYLDNIEAYKNAMGEEITSQVKKNILYMVVVAGIIFAAIISLCLIIVVGIVGALGEWFTASRMLQKAKVISPSALRYAQKMK